MCGEFLYRRASTCSFFGAGDAGDDELGDVVRVVAGDGRVGQQQRVFGGL